MKNLFFGKMKTYRIQTNTNVFDVGGRSYSFKGNILTVRDCFSKVATFVNFRHITEL